MAEEEETAKLIRMVRIRLGQAHRVAEAAETCASEGCHERSMRLLDEVETLIRDAGHLVQATINTTLSDVNDPWNEDEAWRLEL